MPNSEIRISDISSIPKWNNTVESIGWEEEKIRALRILVVGAGALGNEVLKNLALLNVGNIVIVDFDNIEYANLAKSVLYRAADCGDDSLKCEVAARKLKDINPQVKTKAINGDISSDIGLGIIRRMDAVVGCVDNRLARLMLNQLCFKVGKPWVDGAIENLSGEATVFSPDAACYECNLTQLEREEIEFRLSCFDVALRRFSLGQIPTTPISASIVAAMQVQEALKLAMNDADSSMSGTKFRYDGLNNLAMYYDVVDRSEECMSHFQYESIIEAKGLSAYDSLEDCLRYLEESLSIQKPLIKLDNEVILELVTRKHKKVIPVEIPVSKYTEEAVAHLKDGPDDQVSVSSKDNTVIQYLDDDYPNQGARLVDLGIPPLHIIRVIDKNSDTHFVELTGDEDYLTFK